MPNIANGNKTLAVSCDDSAVCSDVTTKITQACGGETVSDSAECTAPIDVLNIDDCEQVCTPSSTSSYPDCSDSGHVLVQRCNNLNSSLNLDEYSDCAVNQAKEYCYP